jgi:hypothetical protein
MIIVEEEQVETTFAKKWGSFGYTVMSFCLKNVSMVFCRIVVATFKDLNHKFIEVYLDDWMVIIILKEHIQALRIILDICR